ncbi:accessory gene regulator B family protein [Macrococcus capreoli]|uniref:accessory gene regulator B family protein n=1 Tax=Macrococcus capreoli TaxID=2982690 RepID=UPI0021D59E0C|nr:accessory gene regulator B family protein [Macrococcus sp. TMW 2.2395]MCU7558250.1 accessory gene regulator B family protein [Macrococcus sp. TMW 2.2395]
MLSRKPYNPLSEIDRLKFKRGLQVIRKNLFISFTIYFTSFCLNILLQVFVVHCCYFMIRYFSFGAHIKNFYLCMLQSLVTFVIIPYCLLHMVASINFTIPGMIAAILIIVLGPQPTKAQPIHHYMMTALHIKTAIITLVLLSTALLIDAPYSMLIHYGIITQSITLLITYMRRKYDA